MTRRALSLEPPRAITFWEWDTIHRSPGLTPAFEKWQEDCAAFDVLRERLFGNPLVQANVTVPAGPPERPPVWPVVVLRCLALTGAVAASAVLLRLSWSRFRRAGRSCRETGRTPATAVPAAP